MKLYQENVNVVKESIKEFVQFRESIGETLNLESLLGITLVKDVLLMMPDHPEEYLKAALYQLVEDGYLYNDRFLDETLPELL